jgi:hypothetical protein
MSIEQHGTGATLTFATSVFRASQVQIFAQNVKEHLVASHTHAVVSAVHIQSDL